MTAALDTACWACSLPPIYVCDGGTYALCSSCARYLRGTLINTVSPAQSAAKTSASPGASVPATPLAIDAASPAEPAVQRPGGAGAFDPQLARRAQAARADRDRPVGCMCPLPGEQPHPRCPVHGSRCICLRSSTHTACAVHGGHR